MATAKQLIDEYKLKQMLEEQRQIQANQQMAQQALAQKQAQRKNLLGSIPSFAKQGYNAINQGSKFLANSGNNTLSNIGNNIQKPINYVNNALKGTSNVANGLGMVDSAIKSVDNASSIASGANNLLNAKGIMDAGNTASNILDAKSIMDTTKGATDALGGASNALGTAGSAVGGVGSALSIGSDVMGLVNGDDAVKNGINLGADLLSTILGFTPLAPVGLGIQAAKGIYNTVDNANKPSNNNLNAVNNQQQGEQPNQALNNLQQNQQDAKQILEAGIRQTNPSNVGFINSAKNYLGGITNGVSQQELDMFRQSINPLDYMTALDNNEATGFKNWVNQNNVPISNDYDMTGYYKKNVLPYEGLAQQGYTPEQIAGVKQGLNGGNAELAKFIQDNNINTPNGENEIALAKQGKLNDPGYNPETKHYSDEFKLPNHEKFSNQSRYYNKDNAKYAGSWDGENYVSPVSSFKTGVEDFKTGFDKGLGSDTDGLWGKIGKTANVASNILGNPALQGVAYALIDKSLGAKTGDAVLEGINWAQNKAKSDYYNKAITGNTRRSLLGSGFDSKDYNAHTDALYNQGRLINDANRVNAYTENIVSQIENRNKMYKLELDKLEYKKQHDKLTLDEEKRYHDLTIKMRENENQVAWYRAHTDRTKANAQIKRWAEEGKQDSIKDFEFETKVIKDIKNLTRDEIKPYLKNLYSAIGMGDEFNNIYNSYADSNGIIDDANLNDFMEETFEYYRSRD